MNPRLVEPRPENLVLDLIERDLTAAGLPRQFVQTPSIRLMLLRGLKPNQLPLIG